MHNPAPKSSNDCPNFDRASLNLLKTIEFTNVFLSIQRYSNDMFFEFDSLFEILAIDEFDENDDDGDDEKEEDDDDDDDDEDAEVEHITKFLFLL